MSPPTILTMKIEKIEPSRHKKGRILIFLEDGTLLKVTEQELVTFGLRAGDMIEEEELSRLRDASGRSGVKADAAEIIGRRAMSRADLEKKLREKGAGANDARYAAEWLEAIGGLNDADYAALLIRHCASMGYGPARYREELRRHGIPRELWTEAMDAAGPPEEIVDRFLQGRFQGGAPDERARRRASDALARRGFGWSDVRDGLRRYAENLSEEQE